MEDASARLVGSCFMHYHWWQGRKGDNMGMTTITMMRKRERRNGQIKSKVVHVFLNIPSRSSFTILLTTVRSLKIMP
jgi:hypothetical protein